MLTDRSRMETYETCPRLRLLTYHYGGMGIVPTIMGYELMFGRIYHEAIETLTRLYWNAQETGTGQPIQGQVGAIITKARAELAKWIAQIPKPTIMFATEQEYLIEGLLWAWVRVKLPELLRDYEVLSLEQEFLWTMGKFRAFDETLIDMVRLDGLLKEKSTESLYYKEYKTTAYGDQRWSMHYDDNAQVMANVAATEEALGQRIAGVLIEGHVKGARRVDTAKSSPFTGMQIQDSPLCYTYDQGGIGNYSMSWRAGAVRRGTWETGFTPRQWVMSFLTEDDCRALFVQLPPISPDPYKVDRWRRQKLMQEERIYQGLMLLLNPATSQEVKTEILDGVFPLYQQSCTRYGRKCSHYDICHDQTIAQDPVSTGAYIERIPHHDAERIQNSPGGDGLPAGGPGESPAVAQSQS